jgi:threonine dehydrogenase-like Zn-dependent dehydrogenase
VRAVRSDGQSVRFLTDAPAPAAGPGEAIVRVKHAGLTPIDVRAGNRFAGTLGHELVGVVEQINLPPDAPANLRARAALKNKRVVAAPSVLCGQCDMCRSGLSPHCRARSVMGLAGRDGALADLVAVPLLNLHAVPDQMSDDHAVLAPQLAAAVHLAHLVRADAKYITILGDNLPALLAALTLSAHNRSARLLGSRPERLALCDRWGLKHRPLDEAGRRQDQDVVIDCTGAAAGLRLALQYVRPRGTIVITSPGGTFPSTAGVPSAAEPAADWAAPVDLSLAVTNEVHILGSRDGSISDGIAFMLEHPVDAPSLISRRFPIEKAADALAAAADPVQLKVVVEL